MATAVAHARASRLPDFNPYLQDAGAATDQEECADEYEGKSLSEVYRLACGARGCRVNTGLHAVLSKEGEEPLECVDLSLNLVGKHGLLPVLEVVKAAKTVRRVILANNFLDNAAAVQVAEALEGVTSVTSLDMSRNPVSSTGGKRLNALLRNNCNICAVCLEQTLINPALKAAITKKAEANASLSDEQRSVRLRQQASLRFSHHRLRSARMDRRKQREGEEKEEEEEEEGKEQGHGDEKGQVLDTVAALADGSVCPSLKTLLEVSEDN